MIKWCCMFKSRRSTLVRRLWRLRCQNEAGSPTETAEDMELKSVAHAMLKRLKEKQLEALIESIESKGAEEGECVLLPKGDNRLGKKTMTSLVLCCKLWRWKDLTSDTEMKRLPFCKSENDPAYDCCNPYHWSLLSRPDVQISNLGLSELEKTKSYTDNLDQPPDEAVSMETGMTPTARRVEYSDEEMRNKMEIDGYSNSNQTITGQHWCTIAYWELRQRVGRLLTVFDGHTNIFQELPHGNGLCLQILQEDAENVTDSVRRTREKIGLGIVLSKETDGVYVYNRSDYPIFVNSPMLENPLLRTFYVHKVLSGYSLKIFDYERGHLMREVEYHDPKYLDGPYDPNTVRISFAKGWGPHYSRQILFSCPCWLELILTLNR